MEQHPPHVGPKSIHEFREVLEQELQSAEAAELPDTDIELFRTLLTDEELLAQFIFPDAYPEV